MNQFPVVTCLYGILFQAVSQFRRYMKRAGGRAGLQARVEAVPENPSAVGTADPRLSCAAPTGLGFKKSAGRGPEGPLYPNNAN